MSRAFVQGSLEYLERAAAPVSAVPFTMAAWFYCTGHSAQRCIVSLAVSAAADQYFSLALDTAGRVAAAACNTSAQTAVTTTTHADNTWNHACGVFAGTADRRVFLNGGGKGTQTTPVTTPAVDVASVGRRGGSSPTEYMSGRIAEVAIWNAALTDAEVAALASGVRAWMLRPANLKVYAPLWGVGSPEPDYSGNAFHFTVTGAAQADHAPVAPFSPWAGWLGASTAASGQTYDGSFALAASLGMATQGLNTLLGSVPLAWTQGLTTGATLMRPGVAPAARTVTIHLEGRVVEFHPAPRGCGMEASGRSEAVDSAGTGTTPRHVEVPGENREGGA